MTSSGGPTIRAKIDAVCLMVEGILMIPKFFKEAEPEELVLQLIFFYKENDTLKLAVRQFTKIDGTSGRFIILPLDTSLVNVPMLHLLSERPDAANRLVDNKPDWYTRMSLIEKARVLIDLAVAEDSSRSGPPIDIICLTRHGSTWIKKKPQCQDP
jgi:hypothetical protein